MNGSDQERIERRRAHARERARRYRERHASRADTLGNARAFDGRIIGSRDVPRVVASFIPHGESGTWGNGARTVEYVWHAECIIGSDHKRGAWHIAPTGAYTREPMYVQRAPRIERYMYAPPEPRAVTTRRATDDDYASFGTDATVQARRADLERRRVRAMHAEHGAGAPSCDDASFHTTTERATTTRERDTMPHAPSKHAAREATCARCVYGLDAPHMVQISATTRALLAQGNAFLGVAGRARNAYASALRRAMRDARINARDVA